MNTKPARYYVVHNRAGRILAVAPISGGQNREGMQLGWRPIARGNQIVTEIELNNEQARLGLHELLAFEIKTDARSGVARLQPIKATLKSKPRGD